MLFLLQIAMSFGLAIIACRRPAFGVAAVLVFASAIPFEVSRTLLGTSWHPATTLSLAIVLIELVRGPRALGVAVARNLGVAALLTTFIAVAVCTSWLTGRAGDLGTIVLQLVAPIMLLFVVRARLASSPDLGRSLARILAVIGQAEAVVIIAVWSGLVPQPWLSTLEGLRWWATDSDRMVGTYEHPLIAGLWLSAAVPLTAAFGSPWLRTLAPVLVTVGILLTGSRFALLAAVAVLVVLILRTAVPAVVKGLAIVAAAAGTVVFLGSSVGATATRRFEDDGGSSSARLKTIGLAVEQWQDTLVIGRGFGASEHVTRNALIGTTFENPFLMFSIDFGLVATVLFFVALVVLVTRRSTGGAPQVRGARLAAVVVAVSIFGFNSLSTNTPIGVLLFVVIAIVAPPRVSRDEPADPRPHADRDHVRSMLAPATGVAS